MPELDPEDWSPARKLEAVRVYGPHKDWRALERVYGKELPVRYVKRWAEQERAGELVAGEPEPGDVEPFPELPELPERLPLSDLRALAELVEPRLRHTLDTMARTRDPRELKEVAIALRASIETLIRLKALSPAEEAVGGDVDAGIEALVAELASFQSFTTDDLVAELDHRGSLCWRRSRALALRSRRWPLRGFPGLGRCRSRRAALLSRHGACGTLSGAGGPEGDPGRTAAPG